MSMKTSYGSPWFVAIGVSAIVFIGAFGRFDPAAPSNAVPIAPVKVVADEKVPTVPPPERPLMGEMAPGLAEVVRLAEAHVDSSVMLAFIQNSGQTYSPTADQILYLSNLGVPQNVLSALYQDHPVQPDATPAAVPTLSDATPPAETGSNLFTAALASFGTWMQLSNYGAAWQPAVELANPDWKPYVNDGQWIDSDSGWYWQSAYTWGWAPFHYGGWVNAPEAGWVWVPGNTWAPAWVAWRSTSSHLGWAPLPPGVSLNVLSQLSYNGHPVTPGFDFGLTLSSYVFVRATHFLSADLPIHVASAVHSASLAAASSVVQNYSVVNNKIINGGISRDVVAAATKQAVATVPLERVSDIVMPSSAPPTLLASAQEMPSLSPLESPALHYTPRSPFSPRHEFGGPFQPGLRFPPSGRFMHRLDGGSADRPLFREGGPPEHPRPTEPAASNSSKGTK
jgi:hypothetical protein